jgi:site-specific DNA-adenine methylase
MREINILGVPQVEETIVPAIPYMGSKRKLATKILNVIYQIVGDFDRVYDLFGGGAAFSIATLMAGHEVHYNEKNTSIVELLRYIVTGKKLPNRWITREEYREKVGGNDWFAGFLQTCWSFGNNSEKGYLFGAKIENLKRLGHLIVVDKDELALKELSNILGVQLTMPVDRLDFRQIIKRLTGERGDLEQLERLQQLQQIQQLESLERIQQIQQIQQFEISNLDYRDVEIVPNSVIYCDPPYAGTAKYKEGNFNHEAFWQWCREQRNPVFVSEYNAPDDFEVVAEFKHRSILSATNNAKVTIEKVYWNGRSLQ